METPAWRSMDAEAERKTQNRVPILPGEEFVFAFRSRRSGVPSWFFVVMEVRCSEKRRSRR
jgi:hypothetical protein